MRIAGIDEAGKGAIAGPLVISGFAVDDQRLIETLKRAGVDDSKKVSRKKRAELEPFLLRRGIAVTEYIQPEEIDQYVSKQVPGRSLNYLEAIYMAKIIDRLQPSIVYVDSPYVDTNRLWRDLRDLLPNRSFDPLDKPFTSLRIIPEHHADATRTIVGAASIIAKVSRDTAIEMLKKGVGDFGSGYPSDIRTRIFLTEFVKRAGEKPDWVRKSWSSWNTWLVHTLT